MSQDASLGVARLVSVLETKDFEATAKRLETDMLARFKRIAASGDSIFSTKSFSGATAVAKGMTTALNPVNDSIKKLAGGVSILQNKLELGEVSERGFTDQTRKLQTELRIALKGTTEFSAEQVKLYRALGQSERGLKTVAGEATRFGIAQQTSIALNRQVIGQLENFGPVGRTAALGIDAMGGSFAAVPLAATAAAGAIGGVVVATGALVQKGKPLLAEYQRSMAILAESGEENLGRFKGELTELQEEGGKAAQAFSRSQLAGSLAETVRAGVSAADAMTLLKTGTQLASAENQDLSDSTGLVLQNLRQFNLGVEASSRAGDALASAGNLAADSAAELSKGLATVGPVANAAGFSLEKTLGYLVNLSNKGLNAAEEGATGLRSVLSALADPTDEARTVFQQLGISLEDVNGNARPAADVLADLKTALNGSETAMASAAKIFDTQGITTILALDESTDQYTQTILDSQGALESYADTMASTADAAEQRMQVALDDLATTAAEFFAPAIAGAATALTGLLRGLDTFFSRISGQSTPVDDLNMKFDAVKDVVGSAQDKKTLAGVLQSLSTQLTGSSKTAVQEFAKEVRNGKGDLEDFKAAAQNLLDEARLSAEIAKVQTELSALESREVAISFSTDLNNVDAVIQQAEERINRSPLVQGKGIQLELGFKEVNGKQVVSILNDVGAVADDTYFEIEALNTQIQGMLAQGSEGSALTEEQANLQTELEATRDRLSGLEGELTDLRSSYADTGEAAAAAVREARDEVERTINEVDFGGYTNDLFINLSIKDPAKLKAEIKTLIESTKLEIQTTDDPAAKASAEARLAGYRQALAAANELVAAERNLVTVRKQAPKPTPVAAPGEKEGVEETNNALSGRVDIINRATTATRNLGVVSDAVLLAQKQYQDTLLAAGGQNIIPAATAIGPNYDLAESAKQAATEQRQLHADMRETANQANATARENAALDAVLKQLAKDVGHDAYVEASNRLDEFGEKARIAKENQEEFTRSFRDGREEADAYSTGIRYTSDQLEAQAQVFSSVRSGLKEAQANYALTGNATQLVADKTQVYQQAIDALISAGFDPLNPKVQEYQTKLEALEGQTARAEAAQTRLKDAVGQAKSSLDQIRDAAGNIDLESFAEGGAEAAGDYLEELIALRDKLLELKDANLKAFQVGGGNELLQALNGLIPKVEEVTSGLLSAAQAAQTLEDALAIFGAITDGALKLAEAMGVEVPDSVNATIDALEGFGSAAQKLASGDVIGAVTTAIATAFNFISDMIVHQQGELDQLGEAYLELGDKAYEFARLGINGSIEFDEASYDAYLQRLEAVKTYGEEIADRFYKVDEQGNATFDAAGLEAFAQGLERVQDRADGIAQAMKDAKDATDSVLEAEISARQDTLDAKLASQGGGYSEADIFEQQAISIGEAAKKRDEAYAKAAEDEANGLGDLAARRRAAAEEAYAAEVSQINSEAEGRAEAIGKNSADFRSRLDQAAQTEGQKWTEYWNQDAAAQLEAQKQAQIQLRRFQQVLNSERYQQLLAEGKSEEVAWQTAANELGYTINQTSGDLVAATDAASQQQSQAITNSGNLLAGAATNLFGGATTQIATDGATLRGQIAGEGSLLSSQITSALGLADSAFNTQGGALSSTISSLFGQLAGDAADGSNIFGTALTNGANLNIGTVADVGNLLGGQITDSGNANKDAIAAAANLQIKQAEKAAKKFSLNDVNFANEVNRVSAKIANARVGVIDAAAVFQSAALADFWNSLIDTNVEGNAKYARSATGGTERVGKSRTRSSGMPSLSPKLLDGIFKGVLGNPNFNADYTEVIDPAKYQEQQAKKVGSPGKASGGGVGSGKGSGSKGSGSKGSGSKGGKGSGGKKDGSSYTGGKPEDYPYGSPGWIQAQMALLDDQIKKSNNQGKIRELQAKREKLQAQLEALLGTGKQGTPEPAAGSIDALQKRLQEAQAGFDAATTDARRNAYAKEIKDLKAQIAEKQKLLEDAAKGAQEGVKGTVISIESPLADLGGLQYLAESVSKSVSSLPTSISAASTGAAASVTRIPETYTSTVLPSYQAQQDMAATMGGHVDRFGAHINTFGRFVREFGAYMKSSGKGGSNSSIPVKAKGQGLSDMMLRDL